MENLITRAEVVGEPKMSREEWLNQRRNGLGSSDASAIAGLNKWKSPLEVYLDKVHPQRQEKDSLPKRLGRELEGPLARIYQEQTGHEVLPPPAMLLRHPSLPWMLASLDRYTVVDGRPRALEIKTCWGNEQEWGEPGSDEVPSGYLIQVQHQLAVTGWEVADVVCMFRGERLAVYEVPRNDILIGTLTQIESDFWLGVQKNQEPALDYAHPNALALVKRLYPGVDDRVVLDLDDYAGKLAEEIISLSEEIGVRQKQKATAQAQLLSIMGEAAFACTPNHYRIARRIVSKGEYVVPAHSELHLKVRPPKDRIASLPILEESA